MALTMAIAKAAAGAEKTAAQAAASGSIVVVRTILQLVRKLSD